MSDADRLEELTARLSPAVLAYFTNRAQPRADAADLLNETLLVAWRRVRSMPRDEGDERAWLFGVASYVLSNHRRSARRRDNLVKRIRGELALEDNPYESFELANDVADAISLLPDTERELVKLIHWDGLSASEAGRVLGIPESTARARYATARDTLRDALADLVR